MIAKRIFQLIGLSTVLFQTISCTQPGTEDTASVECCAFSSGGNYARVCEDGSYVNYHNGAYYSGGYNAKFKDNWSDYKEYTLSRGGSCES